MKMYCPNCKKEVETYQTSTTYGHPEAPTFSYAIFCQFCEELLDED